MTDRAALLSAILADPADDTMRLAFADWLDEQPDRVPCPTCHGDYLTTDGLGTDWYCPKCEAGSVPSGNAQRAEFIRVQVELARRPHCEWCGGKGYLNRSAAFGFAICVCRAGALLVRDRELSAAYGNWWVPSQLSWRVMWGWERGFVEHIRGIESADWIKHEAEICREHPVTRVKLTTSPSVLLQVRHRPEVGVRYYWLKDEAKAFAVDNTTLAESRVDLTPAITRECLRREWPGIQFELPHGLTIPVSAELLDGTVDVERIIRDGLARTLGIAPPFRFVTPPG